MDANQEGEENSGSADLLRMLPAEQSATARAPWVAVIRRLGARHRGRIARHLQALDPHDRYLRFGYMANDEQIQTYADSLDFENDAIFGIYNRRLELVAMAHLAHSVDRSYDACAEFGVSVLPSVRGHGYGSKLFERAMRHARNEGVYLMFIHALSENKAMLNIARKAGATVEYDGSEARAYLRLPPPPSRARSRKCSKSSWPRPTTGSRSRPSSSGTFWPACRTCAAVCARPGTSPRPEVPS